jgi:hypothetical protein
MVETSHVEYAYGVTPAELKGMEPIKAFALGMQMATAFDLFQKNKAGFDILMDKDNTERMEDLCKQGGRTLSMEPEDDFILFKVGAETTMMEAA